MKKPNVRLEERIPLHDTIEIVFSNDMQGQLIVEAYKDMIDALIEDLEVLETCALLMAQKDMATGFVEDRIKHIKKALIKAGCGPE